MLSFLLSLHFYFYLSLRKMWQNTSVLLPVFVSLERIKESEGEISIVNALHSISLLTSICKSVIVPTSKTKPNLSLSVICGPWFISVPLLLINVRFTTSTVLFPGSNAISCISSLSRVAPLFGSILTSYWLFVAPFFTQKLLPSFLYIIECFLLSLPFSLRMFIIPLVVASSLWVAVANIHR